VSTVDLGKLSVPESLAAPFKLRPMPRRFCNLERLNWMMKVANLDGIVSHYSSNVFYLSGYPGRSSVHGANGTGVVIISRRQPDNPILIVTDVHVGDFVLQPTWIDDIRIFAGPFLDMGEKVDASSADRFIPQSLKALKGPDWVKQVRETYAQTLSVGVQRAMKDLGLDRGRVGFDNLITAHSFASREIEVVNAYEGLKFVRQVKTPEEVQVLRTSVQVNQTAIEETVASWSPGMTWNQLNHAYFRIVSDLNGSAATPIANVIMNSADGDTKIALPMRTGFEDDYVLPSGANVMFDCHGNWSGYCWDGGKTWIVDESVRGEQKTIADGCGDALLEIARAMLPGTRISELHAIGRTVLQKYRLPHAREALVYFHGLGLEHNDLGTPPGSEWTFQNRLDWALEKGMVIAVHLAYPGSERERYYIEDIAHITPQGGSLLYGWGVAPLLNTH